MNKALDAQRLTYFTFFWTLAGLMEQVQHNQSWFFMPADPIFIASIIFALCFPNTLTALVFFVSASLAHVFLDWVQEASDLTFEFIINFFILTVIGSTFIYRKTWRLESKDIYLRIAPLLRIFLIIFYFFSFFAKLNKDFLNPHVSCAVWAMELFFNQWFGIHQMPWLIPIDIWGTLVTEFSIPVMLMFKKTRNTAIIIGVCFHWFMGMMVRIEVYSTLFLIMYFVFLSDESFYLIREAGEKLKNIIKKILPNAFIRILAVSMLLYMGILYFSANLVNVFCFWLFLQILISFLFIFSILQSQYQESTAKERNKTNYFLPHPAILLFFVLPLIVYGLSPYLGLRTNSCIAMFSNLRTLGPKPNHLIIGPSFMIFKQRLIKILGSNDPYFQFYANHHYLITEFEFRRMANTKRGNFYVRCIYQGKVIIVHKTDGSLDQPFLRPVPWLERKFIHFRRVDEFENCRCAEGFSLFLEKMKWPPRDLLKAKS